MKKNRPASPVSNDQLSPAATAPIEWMRWVPAALLAIAFLVFAVISGRIILVPILISVALAYLLAPVVGWFERRGWSRSSSALLAITAVSLAAVLILIFVLPGLWKQLSQSYDQANLLVNDPSRISALTGKVKEVNPQLYDLINVQVEKIQNLNSAGEDLQLDWRLAANRLVQTG